MVAGGGDELDVADLTAGWRSAAGNDLQVVIAAATAPAEDPRQGRYAGARPAPLPATGLDLKAILDTENLLQEACHGLSTMADFMEVFKVSSCLGRLLPVRLAATLDHHGRYHQPPASPHANATPVRFLSAIQFPST